MSTTMEKVSMTLVFKNDNFLCLPVFGLDIVKTK